MKEINLDRVYPLNTLEFLINVLDQISVLVGKYGKSNKGTGPNKRTGRKKRQK